MVDTLSPEKRSWNMGRIAGKDTKPEKIVRSTVHRLVYRFTVNGPKNRQLPGKPNIVLVRFKMAILVHGCFWHRHKACKYAYTPKSRVEFWTAKFRENVKRDRRVVRELEDEGWEVVTVWECETRGERESLCRRIDRLLR